MFSLKRFEDIEKIYPKNCGLSTKKVWGSVVTNLIMYLWGNEVESDIEISSDTEKEWR